MNMLTAWPENVPIGKDGYQTIDGTFPRTTAVLKVLGMSKEGLINWAATEERKAVLEAAKIVYANDAIGRGPLETAVIMDEDEFISAVGSALGSVKAHAKQMNRAADIGTEIHQAIQSRVRAMIDQRIFVPTPLRDEVQWAVDHFEEWWTDTGLKAVRTEQAVWDKDLGYAGTIDLIAEHPRLGLGVVDFKTGKSVYDEAHIQVAAYMHAGSRWADLRWGQIVRLPKVVGDPKFEMVPLGSCYKRHLDREQLMEVFRAALTIHKHMVAK